MTGKNESKETLAVDVERGAIRLNLGSGPKPMKGYINVDILPSADVQCDLNKFPWPWRDESVDEIVMWHVFEHLPWTYETMDEIRRILKPDGKFWGRVPFCNCYVAWSHPQHYRQFT